MTHGTLCSHILITSLSSCFIGEMPLERLSKNTIFIKWFKIVFLIFFIHFLLSEYCSGDGNIEYSRVVSDHLFMCRVGDDEMLKNIIF